MEKLGNLGLKKLMLREYLVRLKVFLRSKLKLLTIFIVSLAFISGIYFVYKNFIQELFATSLSSITITSDTDFNNGTLEGLTISGTGDDASLTTASSGGYSYYSEISIQNEQVAGDETDFPVALTLTDSRFATIAQNPTNGRIQNIDSAGGASESVTVPADFVVSPNKDGSDPYDFEIVDYDPSTGYIEMWMEISNLSSSTDTTIYLVYGNSEVTVSQEDVAGTWSNGFEGVYHLGEVSGTYYDSSGNNHHSVSEIVTTRDFGKIGNSPEFDGNDDEIAFGRWDPSSDVITLEAWYNAQTLDGQIRYLFEKSDSWDYSDMRWIFVRHTSSPYLRWQRQGFGVNLYGSDLSTGSWNHLVIVDNGSSTNLYENGNNLNSEGSLSFGADTEAMMYIGDRWDGFIDEYRISSVARSANWVGTSHQNQNTPSPNSTFWSALGSETETPDYQYYTQVDIDNTKVSGTSDLTDFPVLISGTFDGSAGKADLRHTSSGGHVQNSDSNGGVSGSVEVPADFKVCENMDCSGVNDPYPFEVEKYDKASGELVVWIKVPVLDSDEDSTFYIIYGNSGVKTSQESVNDVWSNGYAAVWHLGESDGVVYDSTDNNNYAFDNVNSSGKIGKIGNGQEFNGINDFYSVSADSSITLDEFTVSAWFMANESENDGGRILEKRDTIDGKTLNYSIELELDGTVIGNSYSNQQGWGFNRQSTESYDDGSYHHVVYNYDGISNLLALDGGLDFDSGLCPDVFTSSGDPLSLGSRTKGGVGYYKGYIDEIRISNIARSADWMSTTYNNQSDPSSFYSLGFEFGTTGTYISPSDSNVIDLDWNGGWSSPGFEADVDVPTDSSVNFDVRTSDTKSGLESVAWTGIGTATSTGIFTSDLASIPTGGYRYIQLRATLEASGSNSPSLNSYTINYLSDDTNPSTNPTSISYTDNSKTIEIPEQAWRNNTGPYFELTGASDALPAEENSGIEGYCVYFGTDDTADPETAKGLLGTSEQPEDNSGCPYVTYNDHIDLSTALVSPLSATDVFYLNVRAKDYAGNMYTEADYTLFEYWLDYTPPNNPSHLSAPQTYRANIEDFTVYWPDSGDNAASDEHSGVKGFQYKINDGNWNGSSHDEDGNCADVMTSASYTLDPAFDTLTTDGDGINTFYLRVLDEACNPSASPLTVELLYSGNAPTEPTSLTVDPEESTENSFTFDWDKPETFSGFQGGLSYCYTVNQQPSSSSCDWIDESHIGPGSFAKVPGKNTFYVVARDEGGAVNYGAYTSVNFYANTAAPGTPKNLDISDVSIKATRNWKLALTWDPPDEIGIGVDNYKIYRSTTGTSCLDSFEEFSEVGGTGGTSYVDSELDQQTYYYCVSACDSTDNCSGPYETISAYPDGRYKVSAALESEPEVSDVSTTTATIEWITERDSNSAIQYGLSSGEYFDEEVLKSEQSTYHNIKLTNLVADTTYYFRAKWTDEDGNTGISAEYQFITDPPPTVTNPRTTYVGLDSATIEYTVEGAASVKVYYGTTSSFGGIEEVSTSTKKSSYLTALDGLEDGTKYYYKVNTVDPDGIEYNGSTLVFETLPRPEVSNIQIQQVANTAQPTVRVTWESNTGVTSIASYRPVGSEDEPIRYVDVELIKGDHEAIISDLKAEEEYELVVSGKDKLGNEAVSDTHTFNTATDTRPPSIEDIQIQSSIVKTVDDEEPIAQITVSWSTDEPATSQVEFGEGSGDTYSQKTHVDEDMKKDHVVVISGLKPSSIYHLRVRSVDEAENVALSVDTVTITVKSQSSAFDLVVGNLKSIFNL